MKKGVKFDYKQAYNKNLKPSARLHYLENARHDQDSPAKKYDSPAKKSCSPMNKYGSPMKMGSHAIHKHMGGSPFLASKNPDLEYMPVVEDSTGKRKGTTGDPVMDAFHAKQKRKKEFEKTGGAKKAKVVEAKGASIEDSKSASKEIIKAKPTVKKTKREVKREDRKNERKAKRNVRLDKKIARQTRKGKEAGDGAEKGIDSKALAKRRRVDKLKARKAKNNK